jgi:hypothetical protein
MARMDWYTVREDDKEFTVTKFDRDLEFVQAYKVGKEKDNIAMCDCVAGAKFCRHKQMIPIFTRFNRINSGYVYSFDKKLWKKPLIEQEL